MAPRSHTRPDDIDLKSLWQSAIGSLPRLFVLAALFAAATFGVLSLMAPRYQSETQLAIDPKGTNNPFADPSRSGAADSISVRMDKEAINTHVRALMSPDLGETIVREMKLADRPEFNSAKGSPDAWSRLLRMVGIGAPRASESDQDRALSAYFSRLEVYSPRESRLIGVRFSSNDAELAAAVANRVAETYRENLARQSLTETDDVQKALAPKIARLAEEAAAAEAEVEKFRGEANIFKGGQQATGLNEQQLAELNAELSRVKAARSEAEARAKQAREMQELGSAETLADVQKSPLIQNLVQSRVRVERQISELSATLLPGHPRMRQLTAELKGLKSQIAAEVANVVDGLAKEAKVASLREEAIQRNVGEIKARIVTSGPEEAKLRSLEADAKSKRAELDRLRAQYEANRVRADDSRAIPVEAQIVSSARPASVPVFPKKVPTAFLVAVATLLIGLALVITRGLLSGARVPSERRPRASARDRAERPLPTLPVTAHRQQMPPPAAAEPEQQSPVPVPPRAEPQSRPPEVVAPAPAVAEAKPEKAVALVAPCATTPDALADRLEGLRRTNGSGLRTLFVGTSNTFALANEALGLCRRLADRGQSTIIVDWSRDGVGIAEPLGEPSFPGFSELIDSEARFEDVVHALSDSNVHLIPCGRAPVTPDEPLDSETINFLLDALDDVYDHILVVSRAEPARPLFEAIEGRFDCGVTVVDSLSKLAAEPGTFLGFEVEGIELFAIEPSGIRPRARDRIVRAG